MAYFRLTEQTLHSEALVLLISRSQSVEQSKNGVCNAPLWVERLSRSSGNKDTMVKTFQEVTFFLKKRDYEFTIPLDSWYRRP